METLNRFTCHETYSRKQGFLHRSDHFQGAEVVKIESDSSLFTGNRFPKHSERIGYFAFRAVPNVSVTSCLGKLMCCHYTTAAKTTVVSVFTVYSAVSSIANHFIGLHVLNAILPRSGYKWRRIVLGSRTQSLPPPPVTCQSSAVRSSNLTRFTHGCIEVLRHQRPQHFRSLAQPHAGRQDRNPLATTTRPLATAFAAIKKRHRLL